MSLQDPISGKLYERSGILKGNTKAQFGKKASYDSKKSMHHLNLKRKALRSKMK